MVGRVDEQDEASGVLGELAADEDRRVADADVQHALHPLLHAPRVAARAARRPVDGDGDAARLDRVDPILRGEHDTAGGLGSVVAGELGELLGGLGLEPRPALGLAALALLGLALARLGGLRLTDDLALTFELVELADAGLGGLLESGGHDRTIRRRVRRDAAYTARSTN